MAAKTNTTMSANIQTKAREIDFVSRFEANWQGLREIMGIMRPIRKAPGTALVAKTASITLQSGAVAEGDEIPYSLATVTETTLGSITIEKYAKATTLEAISEHGYDNAIARTDNALLNELQGNITSKFFTYLLTGSLTATYTTFQMALAMARGAVLNAFKGMNKDVTEVVGFVNLLDFYSYLGAAEISVQTQYGLTYVENFMGYRTVFLCSSNEIPQNKVVAVPVENIVMYYVDPSDSDFARAGLEYTTVGETPLVGFHTRGKYENAVSDCFAIMGVSLFAEYLNGIAVVDIGSTETPFA